jgi:hypothetical protein
VNTGALKRMGRPKKKTGRDEKAYGVAIRGSKEWRDWVMDLAEFRRLKATDLIDQALVEYAQKYVYKKPSPRADVRPLSQSFD